MSKPEKRIHNLPSLRERRRELRSHGTATEAVLWTMLQRRQLAGRKFRRQHSVGPYILDFYCPAEQLAVELDGTSHDDPARRDYDQQREEYLREQGIHLVRFENQDVFERPEDVLCAIASCFRAG